MFRLGSSHFCHFSPMTCVICVMWLSKWSWFFVCECVTLSDVNLWMTCTSFTVWCSLSGVFVWFTGCAFNVCGCGQPLFFSAVMSCCFMKERAQKDDPALVNQIIWNHMPNTLTLLQFVSLSPQDSSLLISSLLSSHRFSSPSTCLIFFI